MSAMSLALYACSGDADDTPFESASNNQTNNQSNNQPDNIAGCGDGVLDEGESCDPMIEAGQPGACPTACEPPSDDACASAVLEGDAADCTARCETIEVTEAADGDDCCPEGAYAPLDADCPSSIGDACGAADDCEGGALARCLSQETRGWYEGYCTLDCVNDDNCPSPGSHCAGARAPVKGFCAVTCTSDADCRETGYVCADVDGNGSSECVVGSTGTTPVGEACEGYWECEGRLYVGCMSEERSGYPGGYCTVTCGQNQGTCPAGSACLATADGVGTNCFATCNSDTECRPGYRCYEYSPTIDGGTATVCIPVQ